MAYISKEEVLKIAAISNLQLHEHEVDPLIQQLQAVLSYAERVKEIAAEVEEPSSKNVNVFREDVVRRTDPELILQLAPQRESDYFVVPSILESK